MRRLHPWRALAQLVAGACILAMAGCSRPAPEQALREEVAQLQAAVEARDVDALQDRLADDFIGPDGMDRRGAQRLAQLVFLRNRSVGVTLGPLDVAIQGEGATVAFTAGLTGGDGTLLPDSARVYQVTSGWRMRGEEWELVSIDWTPRM